MLSIPHSKYLLSYQLPSPVAMTMMFIKASCMVALLVVLLTVTVPEVEAVTCGQVVGSVAPCLGYLRNGGSPPPACCNGIRGLRNQARTTADRKAICNCLKSASSSYRGVSGNNAASLPGKCGVNLPYKISPSTDCNRIQ
ncbi:putative plant non-specific lipid-transfer protein/Par allergen [Helianthus annuus]|nr:putative plant non-specific lipid-transfer protein/Par allergen [Helianthus annuus]